MINQEKTRRVLWYETIGFLLLIALSWVNELVGLPQLIFGGPPSRPSIHEAAMETLAIVIVWGVVFIFTKRLMQHLFYLDGFVRVCAWCRKIGHDDEWFGVEDYFARGFEIKTSHGMCPECQRKWLDENKRCAA